MNEDIKNVIFNKIKEYNRIIISRHTRPDGDAVGSTEGLREIICATYPEKEVYLVTEDTAEYLSFLNPHNDTVADELYADALVIVLDTASIERVSNGKVLLGKELIRIDHHINITPYGDYSWVEEERSSLCEMITDFYNTYKNELVINKASATYLYTGMVTDTGRFKYRSVSGETLRLAALLLDCGIDTDVIYANLSLEDESAHEFYAYAYKQMKISENGVISIFLSEKTQAKYGLSKEDASNVISLMDTVKNCIVWIAFIEYGNTIRVRLRSRFVTVSELGEKYGGGGHACAAGAVLTNRNQIKALLSDADNMVKEYKANNKGWL